MFVKCKAFKLKHNSWFQLANMILKNKLHVQVGLIHTCRSTLKNVQVQYSTVHVCIHVHVHFFMWVIKSDHSLSTLPLGGWFCILFRNQDVVLVMYFLLILYCCIFTNQLDKMKETRDCAKFKVCV